MCPVGGGTKLGWGGLGEPVDVELSTAGLDERRRAQRGRPDRGARGRRAAGRGAGRGSPRPARCSRSTRRSEPATRPRSAASSPPATPGPLRHRYGAARDLVVGHDHGARRRHRRAGGRQGDQERRRATTWPSCSPARSARSGLIVQVVVRLHPLASTRVTLRVDGRRPRASSRRVGRGARRTRIWRWSRSTCAGRRAPARCSRASAAPPRPTQADAPRPSSPAAASVVEDDAELWEAPARAAALGGRRGRCGWPACRPTSPAPGGRGRAPGRDPGRGARRSGSPGSALDADDDDAAASRSASCARRLAPVALRGARRPAGCAGRSTSGTSATRAARAGARRVKERFDPQRTLRPGRLRGGHLMATDRAFDDDPPAEPGPDRRLRPLRLLPDHLPDLRALGRGDGLAPRPDRADAGRARGGQRAVGRAGHPHRPLPRLHGLRHRLPVGRPVRQADRGHPRPGRAQHRPRPAPSASSGALLFAVFTHPGRLRALAPLLAGARRLGLDRVAARSRGAAPLPAAARARRAHPAHAARVVAAPAAGDVLAARAPARAGSALLQGCVQRVFFRDVNLATARVLAAEGFEVTRRASRAAAARCSCTRATTPTPPSWPSARSRRSRATTRGRSTPPAAARR